jgi:predicted acetyltransferase
MAQIEEPTPGSLVRGILRDAITEIAGAKWRVWDVVKVLCK